MFSKLLNKTSKSKTDRLEKKLAKKARIEREELQAEEDDFRMLGFESTDLATGESIPFSMDSEDCDLLRFRELKAEITAEMPNAIVSLEVEEKSVTIEENNVEHVEYFSVDVDTDDHDIQYHQ
ncbi:hypothetical protein MFLAVUS_011263 [Mucor flavus]|uniref:Uncharacterized protein n=1 Tax=Mucor flavus TaxID=439312 RepID=A0ABP9ZF20_9FUNG